MICPGEKLDTTKKFTETQTLSLLALDTRKHMIMYFHETVVAEGKFLLIYTFGFACNLGVGVT